MTQESSTHSSPDNSTTHHVEFEGQEVFLKIGQPVQLSDAFNTMYRLFPDHRLGFFQAVGDARNDWERFPPYEPHVGQAHSLIDTAAPPSQQMVDGILGFIRYYKDEYYKYANDMLTVNDERERSRPIIFKDASPLDMYLILKGKNLLSWYTSFMNGYIRRHSDNFNMQLAPNSRNQPVGRRTRPENYIYHVGSTENGVTELSVEHLPSFDKDTSRYAEQMAKRAQMVIHEIHQLPTDLQDNIQQAMLQDLQSTSSGKIVEEEGYSIFLPLNPSVTYEVTSGPDGPIIDQVPAQKSVQLRALPDGKYAFENDTIVTPVTAYTIVDNQPLILEPDAFARLKQQYSHLIPDNSDQILGNLNLYLKQIYTLGKDAYKIALNQWLTVSPTGQQPRRSARKIAIAQGVGYILSSKFRYEMQTPLTRMQEMGVL